MLDSVANVSEAEATATETQRRRSIHVPHECRRATQEFHPGENLKNQQTHHTARNIRTHNILCIDDEIVGARLRGEILKNTVTRSLIIIARWQLSNAISPVLILRLSIFRWLGWMAGSYVYACEHKERDLL